jgi:hypothetical protein
MSKIENSPLIEAMFELRWGEKQPGNFKFNRDEMDLLPGVFSQAIKQTGYGVTERLPKVPDIPAIPKNRFRKAPNKGERGMVFETRVISKLKDEEKSVGSLVEWAENAHTLQRHSFDTLICNR